MGYYINPQTQQSIWTNNPWQNPAPSWATNYNPPTNTQKKTTSTSPIYTNTPSASAPIQQPQQQSSSYQIPAYQAPQQPNIDELLNSSYNAAYSRLGNIEADYNAQYATNKTGIEQSYAAVLPELEKSQATQIGGLEQQSQTGKKEQSSQIAKARQLYNELQQSNLTRFGGASSTGQASRELLGRSAQSQFGDINAQAATFQQGIEKEKATVNTYFQDKKENLEKEKQLKLQEMKDTFDSKIREINSQRATLDSQKAQARLQALQEFSSQVRQQQADYTTFTTQLNLWKQYKDEALANARAYQAKTFTVPGFSNILPSYTVTRGSYGTTSTPIGYYNLGTNQDENNIDLSTI